MENNIMIVSPAQGESLSANGKHQHLLAKPENYTPATKKPEDCICGAKGDETKGRLLIPNCPCCDGVQTLVVGECSRGEACPDKSFIPLRVTLPPPGTKRFRYIDIVEPIS